MLATAYTVCSESARGTAGWHSCESNQVSWCKHRVFESPSAILDTFSYMEGKLYIAVAWYQRQATVVYNDGFTKNSRRPCAAVSRTYWQLPTLTSGPLALVWWRHVATIVLGAASLNKLFIAHEYGSYTCWEVRAQIAREPARHMHCALAV